MKLKKFSNIIFILSGFLLFNVFNARAQERPNKEFKTVIIGEQEWMAENLNVCTFKNGDRIARARTRTEWQQAHFDKKPAWCFYAGDSLNGETYGRLYNWYAVNDPRGLAPVGWHVPSDSEWTTLVKYLGGPEAAGEKLKNSSGWKENGYGINSTQFSALPGGACANDGYLGSLGYLGVWWSATADTSYYYDPDAYAWYRYLFFSKDEIIRYSHSKGNGFSVRCIKD
jgi:uncharacterized protein (TIGR02145 family)